MNKKIKEISAQEYIPVLIDLINQGNTVPLLISGNSMSPFLVHHRDTIFISKPDKPLKKGDIVFYIRKNGEYVVHRVHHINSQGQLFIVGDGQTIIEGPVEPEQIFGIIRQAKRKDKIITKRNIIWKLFSIIWIRIIKYRYILLYIYSNL